MKIIVSLTSWIQRISTVYKTIDSILNQSLKPDLIELNLSLIEFPNKEQDLPEVLCDYENSKKIEINWVSGNTRTFKKIIPTLQKFYGEEYLLLSVDDDVIYGSDYVKTMVENIEENDSDTFCASSARVIGNRTIFKSTAFEPDFWKMLTDDVIQYGIDDSYTSYYLRYKKRNCASKKLDSVNEMIKVHDEQCPLHNEYRQGNRVQLAEEAIRKVFNLS